MLVASIDLMDGKAVQLQQGKTKVLERENVIELAKYYARFGEVAVIDLDCALNTGKNNEELIKKICKVAPCRVGGGIRTVEKAKEYEECNLAGVNSYLADYNIGVIFECLGHVDEALEYYKRCLGYPKAEDRVKALTEK